MMNFIRACGAMVIVLSSFFLYRLKIDAHAMGARIGSLRSEILYAREMVDILEAEWHYLDRPDRLQALSQRYLDMQIVSANQIIDSGQVKDFFDSVGEIDAELRGAREDHTERYPSAVLQSDWQNEIFCRISRC